MNIHDLLRLSAQVPVPGLGAAVTIGTITFAFCRGTVLRLLSPSKRNLLNSRSSQIKQCKLQLCFASGHAELNQMQQQCRDLGHRCVTLLLALYESSEGLDGSRVASLIDEVIASVPEVAFV
jgi:hypothetical protein